MELLPLLEKSLWYTLCNILLMLFIVFFLPLRFRRFPSVLIACATLLILFILDHLRFIVFSDMGDWIYYVINLIEIILVQASTMLLSQYRDGRTLFTGMAASNFVLPGYVVGMLIYAASGNFWLGLACCILISLTILLLLIRFSRENYLAIQRRSKTGWLSLCFIPACFYLLFFFLTSMPVSILNKPDDLPAALLAVFTMLVTYVVVINYITHQNVEQDIEQRKALLEGYMKSLDREMDALEHEQKHLNLLRHDMRHYVGMLSVMLAEGDFEGMQRVIGEVDSEIDALPVKQFCSNVFLNSALHAISLRATQRGVQLATNIALPECFNESELEFSTVVTNLVENAIEAISLDHLDDSELSESQQVKVLIQPIKNQLIVEVTNPCTERIFFDPKTKLPLSSKGEEHGFGLQSVCEFAERRGGAFDCEYDQEIFVARLMIPYQ